MEGEWVSLQDFLADNQIAQALDTLCASGVSTAKDVRLLKDEDVERMQQQQEKPLKKLTAKKLKLCLAYWRVEAIDMAIPLSSAPQGGGGVAGPAEYSVGFEAADYVSKWYRAQIVGFDHQGYEGANQVGGGEIKQTAVVPAGGFRLLVHFEGWSPKWDEYLVFPTQAWRLKALGGGAAGATGNSRDPAALVGKVFGLKVQGAGGTRNAHAKAIHLHDTRGGAGLESWAGLTMLLLLEYEDRGAEEWLDLSDPASRARLLSGHKFTYPTSTP